MSQNKEFDELLQNLNEKNLEQYAKTHLNAQKQQKLQEILSDKRKLNHVLHSKQAQQILKKLRDAENGKPQ